VEKKLENKDAIREEFLKVLEEKNLFRPYFNQSLTSATNKWKTIGLKFWSINNFKNQKEFPVTTSIINQIPELISASFNKLEAQTQIMPHNGDTNGILRCHLGLIIEDGLPNTGFQVKNEKRAWKKDDLIVFTDAHYHTAFNFSNHDRYIFLFDIVREEVGKNRNNMINTVLSGLFLQKLIVIFKFKEYKGKRHKLKPIVALLKPFAQVSAWFVNFIKLW